MAKTVTKAERDLADRLHEFGLRKRAARSLAQGATAPRPPSASAARDALKDIVAKVERTAKKTKKKGKTKKKK
ncbi:MAG: hypothetical protein ACR2KV_02200 [Solirubrobacteraceae bacterium]